MSRLKRFPLFAAVIAASGFLLLNPPVIRAQAQTVTQQVFTGYSGSPQLVQNAIANIGQATHYFTITSHGATCSGVYSVLLVGSYSGSLGSWYLPQSLISTISTGVGANTQRTYQASGAYPALNMLFTAGNTSTCTFDGYYTGVLGSGLGPAVTPNAFGSTTGFTGGALSVYAGNNGTLATAGDTILFAAPNYGATLAVYGLQLCNVTSAQTVKFKNTTGGGAVVYQEYPNMAAGQCVLVPTGQLPIWQVVIGGTASAPTANGALVINLANSTEVDVTVWFREE
jgi:hypothetical protein